MEAGIDAFKIEGRMKSLYYVAGVTRVYRHCIDSFAAGIEPDPEMLGELEKVSHREYTTGFYFSGNLALAPTITGGYIREYTFLGHVLEKKGPKSALVRAMNRIMNGGNIEAISTSQKAAYPALQSGILRWKRTASLWKRSRQGTSSYCPGTGTPDSKNMTYSGAGMNRILRHKAELWDRMQFFLPV